MLEFFIQCCEAGLSQPWVKNTYEKLFPLVIESTKHSSAWIQKRVACAQLIEGVRALNAKLNNSEDKSDSVDLVRLFCDLIALHRESQLLSSKNNYRTFLIANAAYFDLCSRHHTLLNNYSVEVVTSLYPQKSPEEIKKIASTLSWKDFPEIRMIVNDEKITFHLIKGEMINQEGLIQLNEIPNSYNSASFGPEFDHQTLIKNLKANAHVTYHSIREYDFEDEVLAVTENEYFHFQKNTQGKPNVFLTRKSEPDCIYQKLDKSCFKDNELNKILAENSDYTIWINIEKNSSILILDKNYKPCFSLNPSSKKLISVETGEQILLKSQLYQAFPSIYVQLKQFAGDDFYVYQKPNTSLLRIEIPKYSMTFHSNPDSPDQLIFTSDPKWSLETRLNFPGAMIVRDKKDNYCLFFPDLPYLSSNKEGYFIKTVPDYDLHSFRNLQKQSETEFKRFKNQSHYFKIKVDSEGSLQPKALDEKLFICYYLLNNKRYEHALSIIKGLSKEETLENSFNILELLHRIVIESPKKTSLQGEAPFTESILAIKIRAILLAAKLKVSKKINWTEAPLDFTHFAKLKEVKDFFEAFPNAACAELINQYVRHISQGVYPESWRITDEELRILINFDLSEKLNKNKQIFQWKGISAIKPKAPSDIIAKEAKNMIVSLNASNEKNTVYIEQYKDYCNTEEKQIFQRETKLADNEIALAEQNIDSEEMEKRILIQNAKNLLEKDTRFKEHLLDQINVLEQQVPLKEQLLALCHQLQLNNPDIQLAIISNDMTELMFEDLITAYLRNNPEELGQKLGVPEKDPIISHIFIILENILKSDIQLKRLNHLDYMSADISQFSKEEDMLQWIKSLRELDSAYQLTEKNRELLVFEYYEKKRLRPEQIRVIEHMLQPGNENSAIQFKMGGGKTSTLLPLAAIKNADGKAISIIIVPESMLTINEKQLDLSTSRLFSSKSLSLHFTRETALTRDSALRILNSLKNTQKQHGYLVTSRETLQALELKYLELSSKHKNPKDIESRDCIKMMKEILLLLREKGKAIIDEVDSVLDIRKEFNYSNGDAAHIDSILVSDTLTLYRCLSRLPKIQWTAENINSGMIKLFDQLLEEKGTLSAIIQRFSKDNIKAYLLGSSVQTDFLDELNSIEKERIALLK
ncbi:MAG: DUF3638 domain-containing protein, partial [Gammaproteobacteria bacterium]|nr:DUF3638 domain-containing protein [Gammaproteobacteria bacterium]